MTQSKTIRVYVTADTEAEALRIVDRLGADPNIRIAGYASTRAKMEEDLTQPGGPKVDLLVTDVVLSGVDVTPVVARVRRLQEDTDILVYTTNTSDSTVMRAILAGAMGYLLKGDQEDLETSIRLLRGGGSPVSPVVARNVLRAIQTRSLNMRQTRRRPTEANDLSQRETEILSLLAKGISFADIAQILSISPHTVTAHIKKIYRKLQVHSRGEAVYEATCLGILQERFN